MSHDPAILAEQVAVAIHDLARLTRPGITALNCAELAQVAGALAQLSGALPQVLAQLSTYLDGTADRGPAEVDPSTGVGHARACLRRAGAAAEHLTTALDAAHQTLRDLD